ncbi:MAG: hypothetical protein RRB13_16180 [bacterium]|nr:hypothetical protein [bacterium]
MLILPFRKQNAVIVFKGYYMGIEAGNVYVTSTKQHRLVLKVENGQVTYVSKGDSGTDFNSLVEAQEERFEVAISGGTFYKAQESVLKANLEKFKVIP